MYTILIFQVNITGVSYQNLTTSQMNDRLNQLLGTLTESKKKTLVKCMADLLMYFKNRLSDRFSPKSLMTRFLNNLKQLSKQLPINQPYMQNSSIKFMLSYLLLFIWILSLSLSLSRFFKVTLFFAWKIYLYFILTGLISIRKKHQIV